MSDYRAPLAALTLLLTIIAPGPVCAQVLSIDDAVARAISGNPRIGAGRSGLGAARQIEERERTRLVPGLEMEAGIRDGATPQIGPAGVQLINTQALTSRALLSYASWWGTRLSFGAQLDRQVSDSVIFGDLGTIWNAGASLSLTQPLLRGFGPRIQRATIREAQAGVRLAEAELEAERRALSREVRRAYWILWGIEAEARVARAAIEVAEAALAVGERRAAAGLEARERLIALEAEIASSRERVVAIAARRAGQRAELGALLGGQEVGELDPAPPKPVPMPDGLTEAVLERSAELERLNQEQERARVALELAEDRARPNLEAIATLDLRGLGREASSSLEQLGRLEALVGYAGLRLEWPFFSDTLRAEAERARLIERQIGERAEAARLTIAASAASALAELNAADERARLALRSAELSQRSVELVRRRFEAGEATSLDLIQALAQAREAELRVAQARVDYALARVTIDEMLGR